MPTSTAAKPPPPPPPPHPVLIPTLPDDIAINCLARIPRSHHPILSLVSKPICSLLSSSLLYTTRSLLSCDHHFLYLCLRIPTNPSLLFFTLHQSPYPTTTTRRHILVPVPPIPSMPQSVISSTFAVEGHRIYVFRGSVNDVPSPHVWALDCRVHAWEPAPKMCVRREFPTAGVIGGRIYVIGGCLVGTWSWSRNWAKVFNSKTSSWNPVSSQIETRKKWMHASAVIDDKMYAMADRGGMKYNPENQSWESVETEVDLGWRGRGCVVDGVLYCYDYLGKIRGFNMKKGEWRELKGVEGLLWFLCGATMTNLGGKLVVVVWEENGGSGKEMGIRYAEIVVERGRDGELWGKIGWSDVVPSVPKGSSIVHCIAVKV
ncbi:hypothetical protein EZV62_012621 [Acer yangbiense]|uniref:F-box domain-containing protein n=1 Tax=Acer yangbiense TaxID=1000413 RepID=A0A5C7HWS0_9ROSI|nr:hypothetical protein EZV62_012621 [Acer yangbiense]